MKQRNTLWSRLRLFSLLFSTFMVNSIFMFAQTDDYFCATVDYTNSNFTGTYSYSTEEMDLVNLEPLVLNVYYWQVKSSTGTYGGEAFSEDLLLENIAYLNIHFNKFNIFFKYRGYDVIEQTPNDLPVWEIIDADGDGDTECTIIDGAIDPNGYGFIERCQATPFFIYAWSNHRYPNAINIYVPYGAGFGGAARGVGSNRTIIPVSRLNTITSIHEVGHNLGLYHTRSNNNGPSNKEHTTRVQYGPGGVLNDKFNADEADDKVVDTAANTQFSHMDTYPWYDDECEYFGLETDEQGTLYQISSIDLKNAMSDAFGYNCISEYLTPGQGHRMRETIEDDFDLYTSLTTVASLYEPYKGDYYLGGPVQEVQPSFQPGFTYRFIECDCECEEGDPNPTEYDNTDFTYNSSNVVSYIHKTETDYRSITHPNHTAINIVMNPAAIFPQPRRCYDFINGTPIGGKVTRFNDNVYNANVTITPKDSTQINNPQLINNLAPGLYAIDKDFPDGTKEQTIISKENN